MKTYTRRAVAADLNKYCHLAKPDSFMEVCEWSNGEGIDVCIDEKMFSMTWGEYSCLQVLAYSKE